MNAQVVEHYEVDLELYLDKNYQNEAGDFVSFLL